MDDGAEERMTKKLCSSGKMRQKEKYKYFDKNEKRKKKRERELFCVCVTAPGYMEVESCSNIQHLIFFKGAYSDLDTAEHGQTVGRILVSEDSLSFIL